MAYAVLRVAKIKTAGNAGSLSKHLERERETPNADRDLMKYNNRFIGSGDLNHDIQQRIEQVGCTVRKNAVLAIEHIMTASPEHFNFSKAKNDQGEAVIVGNLERWKAFEKNCVQWLDKQYGRENIVNFTVHMDEQTPHIHAVVVPIDQCGKLNCRNFLGGREKLRDMQTSFAEVHKAQGLERGIQGSKAKHQEVQRFYGILNEIYQEPEIKIEVPQVKVKAPEKDQLLGIEIGYKQDPGQLAAMESQRINRDLVRIGKEQEKKALEVIQVLQMQARQGRAVQNRNKGLERTAKGLNKEIDKLTQQNKHLQEVIRGVIEGKIKPQDLKQEFDKQHQQQQGRGMGIGM